MNIVVTGASSGIGYEAALTLSRESNNCIIAIARSSHKLAQLAESAATSNPDCSLSPLTFDIIHGDYENELLPHVEDKFGAVDVLINNAGLLVNKPFKAASQLDFAEMLQANFLSHVKMIHYLLPFMSKGSHILNIGSMGGYQGSSKFAGLSAYSASKSALHTLTECLAAELADDQVKVNCLALGSAQTEMLEKAFPGYQSPVSAKKMGKFIADFAVNGHKVFNGKVLPVSVTTP